MKIFFLHSNRCLSGIQGDDNNQRKILKPIRVYKLHIDNNNFLLKLYYGHEHLNCLCTEWASCCIRVGGPGTMKDTPQPPSMLSIFSSVDIQICFIVAPQG